jgi:hypothetical protein
MNHKNILLVIFLLFIIGYVIYTSTIFNNIEGASTGMTYTATDMQAIIKCADKSGKYSGFTADNISTILTESPSVFDVSGVKIVCTNVKNL